MISRTAQAVLRGRIADNSILAAVLSHRLRSKQREEEWPLVTSYTLNELTGPHRCRMFRARAVRLLQ